MGISIGPILKACSIGILIRVSFPLPIQPICIIHVTKGEEEQIQHEFNLDISKG